MPIKMEKGYVVCDDGTYLYDGKKYKYKLTLVGRDACAVRDAKAVVLMNRDDLTYDDFIKSQTMSSRISKMQGSIVLGWTVLDEEEK